MKFNNFKVARDSSHLLYLGLRGDGSVNDRVAKNVHFANTFGDSVIDVDNEEEEEEEILPIHQEKYSSADSFPDYDVEISFSIFRSRFLRLRIFLFLTVISRYNINHSRSHRQCGYSIKVAMQSARIGLQLFGGRNLDVTLYFAELESRNSERRSSVEQVNLRVCSLHWDRLTASFTVDYYYK